MRRLVTWLLVTLGIAALVRKLRKRDEPGWATAPGEPAPPSVAETTPEPAAEGDPAAELRERLARSRADVPSSDEESPDDRRAAVHEQGRATLDEMQPRTEQAHEEQ